MVRVRPVGSRGVVREEPVVIPGRFKASGFQNLQDIFFEGLWSLWFKRKELSRILSAGFGPAISNRYYAHLRTNKTRRSTTPKLFRS